MPGGLFATVAPRTHTRHMDPRRFPIESGDPGCPDVSDVFPFFNRLGLKPKAAIFLDKSTFLRPHGVGKGSQERDKTMTGVAKNCRIQVQTTNPAGRNMLPVLRAVDHRRAHCRTFATALLTWLLVSSALATEWQDLYQRDLNKCESFPAEAYETGLLFNPSGRRTYYERSRCLQGVAIEWRDTDLCGRVKERRSLFFSGNAISEKACKRAVAEQLAEDLQHAESIRSEDFHRPVSAHFERPHYAGGHFRLHIETKGSHAGTYQIRIGVLMNASSASSAVDGDATDHYIIEDARQALGSEGRSLVKTIDQQQIFEVFRNQSMDREVRVRINLELPPRSHEDQFVLALLPIESRRSTFDMQVDFSKL